MSISDTVLATLSFKRLEGKGRTVRGITSTTFVRAGEMVSRQGK